jgi:hypothetical protein
MGKAHAQNRNYRITSAFCYSRSLRLCVGAGNFLRILADVFQNLFFEA